MMVIDSSKAMLSSSETAFQSPKKTADAATQHSMPCRRGYYSSDEEDDSRDRQSHWKRIKTRAEDTTSHGRSLVKWAEPRQDASPARRPLQTLIRRGLSPNKGLIAKQQQQLANNAPGHRVIVLKSRWHDGAHGLDVAKDGGTASAPHMIRDDGPASKRKFEPDHGMLAMNIDMYQKMRVHQQTQQQQQMARRLPDPPGRYQVRVREEGEFYDDDDEGDEGDEEEVDEEVEEGDDDHHGSLFLEDSNSTPRPNITVDLRDALNRRPQGALVAARESQGLGDDGPREPGLDMKARFRRVNFDLSCASERSEWRKERLLPPPPLSADEARRGRSAAAAGSQKRPTERDTEAERRRERWAEKERDLERDLHKELQKQVMQKQDLHRRQQQSMATTAQQPKSVTVVDYSHKFTVAKAPLGVSLKPVESDPHRLCQRQKQIDYGKNTLGYERYTETIPRYQRTKAHPRTPDIRQVCSKRSWDGQIRKWRRLLHEYDPPKEDDDEDPDQMFVPTREHDGMRGSAADGCMMDVQSELMDSDLKIYDGWSDEEC